MMPYNSGARDSEMYLTWDPITRKILSRHRAWTNMHYRCDPAKNGRDQKVASYGRNNSSVCEQWFDYQVFSGWWEDIEYREDGWCLDKDILLKNNTIYSPETCCFVPTEINTLFVNNKINRGELPLGVSVSKDSGKFVANLSTRKTQRRAGRRLGTFNTLEDAFQAYKAEKEIYIKLVAEEWKTRIDPKVYTSMINWEIEISD